MTFRILKLPVVIKGLLLGHRHSPATLKCKTADHTWVKYSRALLLYISGYNFEMVIREDWFPVKLQVLHMHTNSAIIYRHRYVTIETQACYQEVIFFLKYSTYFKDSRSSRRVHSYLSVHSSHQCLPNKHAANCIECTSNSTIYSFISIISITGKIFTCISCIWDLSVY